MILFPFRSVGAAIVLLAAAISSAGAVGPPTAAEVGADGIQHVAVTLDSYSFAPDHIVVQAGKPVEFTLTSVTTITPHNFVLDDPAAGFRINADVGAGKTVTVRVTPMQPGSFAIFCDKKLLFFKSHREKGMEGRLDVR
jgi:plastocyanin